MYCSCLLHCTRSDRSFWDADTQCTPASVGPLQPPTTHQGTRETRQCPMKRRACATYSLRKKTNPRSLCLTFNRPSYFKKLKRQITYKVLIIFYHLTTMEILIIKKFYIRQPNIEHKNPVCLFFFIFRRREYVVVTGIDESMSRFTYENEPIFGRRMYM
jgi:hypothetical protein